jgi:hypothetical protein
MGEAGLWSLMRLGTGMFLILMSVMIWLILFRYWRTRKSSSSVDEIRSGQRQLAVVMSLIAISFGVITIIQAFELEVTGRQVFDPLHNKFVLGSMGALWLSGLFLVMWFVGDRSYGRTRCPRCWYDMSARASLTCPECGREARRESHLRRTRRRRLTLAAAICLALPSMYLLRQSEPVARHGWSELIPHRALIMGWSVLPEPMILDMNKAGARLRSDTSLETRIDRGRVSERSLISLGKKLIEPIMDDPDARWEHRRGRLLSATQQQLSYTLWGAGADKSAVIRWYPESLDLGELLKISSDDIVDALIAVEHERANKRQREIYEQVWDPNIFIVAVQWYRYRAIDRGTLDQDSEGTHQIAKLTSMRFDNSRPLLESKEFRACLLSQDDTIVYASLLQLYYRLELDHAIDWYCDIVDQGEQRMPFALTYYLPWFLPSVENATQERLMSSLERWVQSTNPNQYRFAIAFCAHIQGKLLLQQIDELQIYKTTAYKRTLQLASERIQKPETEIGRAELQLAAYAQPDGSLLFPLVAQLVQDGRAEVLGDANLWYDTLRRNISSRMWVKHISPILSQTDASTAMWLLQLVPDYAQAGDYEVIVADLQALEAREGEEGLRKHAAARRNWLDKSFSEE